MLGRYGRPGIAHLKRHVTCASLDGHPDPLAVGRVTQRIGQQVRQRPAQHQQIALNGAGTGKLERSEEHTSELQSLMRISYAVFCLKKKTTLLQQTTTKT